jgi:hypothetical protein
VASFDAAGLEVADFDAADFCDVRLLMTIILKLIRE